MTDAELCKHVRTELGNKIQGYPLTQEEFAQKIGIKQQHTISKIENGKLDIKDTTRNVLLLIKKYELNE